MNWSHTISQDVSLSRDSRRDGIPFPPILVIDADDAFRETLVIRLDIAGFAVTPRATIAEGLDYLHHSAACRYIVLLDFFFEGDNADILLAAVEQDAALARHDYVLLTTCPVARFAEEARRLIRACCIEVVYKPFTSDRLYRVVERAAVDLLLADSASDNTSHQE